MAKEYDLSQMTLDETEEAINSYDPYDIAEPPSFELSKQEPPPEFLSMEEANQLLGLDFAEPPETLSIEEAFPVPELRAIGGAVGLAGEATKLTGKAIWKTLGVLSWPFERIEAGLATPTTAILRTIGPLVREPVKAAIKDMLFGPTEINKDAFKNMVRSGLTPYAKTILGKNFEPILEDLATEALNGEISDAELDEALGESKTALPELIPAFLRGAKSFVPFTHNDPEKVRNFNDVAGAYYETLTGEPKAPEWYKQIFGVALSFLVLPTVFGKILKMSKTGLLKIPAIGKIANRKLPAWEEAKLIRKANIYERNERAAQLGKTLAKKDVQRIAKELSLKTGKTITPEAVKLRLGQIIKGSVTEQESLATVANPVIQELQANFKELQKLGILGKETYLTKLTKARIKELTAQKEKLAKSLTRLQTAPHYVKTQEISAKFPGRAKKIADLQSKIDDIDDILWNSKLISGELYMPRMYATKEAEAAARKFPVSGGPKVKAPYAKAREKIPLAARKEMGEILEPAYPVTKRLIQESMDIETAKLFEAVAKHGEWIDDVWREGLAAKALPNTKPYGALAGKFVTPQVYNDVTELNRIRSDVGSLYDSIIGTWKLGKVTLNPATHFRNTISNSILLDLSGTDHVAQGKLMVRAIKEIKSGSGEFKTAQKYFARTTMISGELLDDMLRTVQTEKASGLQKTINVWNKAFGKATGTPAKIYQQEEFIFKFMKYLEQREQGKSIIGAVQEANKWLFDYGDLSKFEKVYVRKVMPFYTFPRKALPRVLEAAADRPLTLAKYPLLAWAEEKYALHNLELTDKDYDQIKKVLPEYMKSGGYLLMPWRDANGDLQFFDWTYIVPWGELFDVQDRGLLSETVTNPLFVAIAETMLNKTAWSNKEIWQETDTDSEKTFKKMLHVWQTAVPSLMYKGIYWDKLYESATGKPSKMGKIRPLAPTIAHTIFGLRTQPIDVEEQERFRIFDKQKKVEELESKIRDIIIREANGNIEEEEYTKRRDQYFKQIEEILKE